MLLSVGIDEYNIIIISLSLFEREKPLTYPYISDTYTLFLDLRSPKYDAIL